MLDKVHGEYEIGEVECPALLCVREVPDLGECFRRQAGFEEDLLGGGGGEEAVYGGGGDEEAGVLGFVLGC